MHAYSTLFDGSTPFAIVVSAVLMLAVGGLWQSPLLFARATIRHSGIRPGDRRPQQARVLTAVRAITTLLLAFLLAIVADHCGPSAAMLAISVGFIWLFVMLHQLNGFLWRGEPVALFLLVTFRSLATLMAGGFVFYFWR